MKKFTLSITLIIVSLILMQNLNAQTIDDSVRTIKVKHTTLLPVIDGNVDDVWQHADSALIDTTGIHWGPGQSNPDDYSSVMKTLWNGKSIYVLVKVKDDELIRTMNWASGDYFEITTDFNNTNSPEYVDKSNQFYALRAGWNAWDSVVDRNGPSWDEPKNKEFKFFSKVDSIKTGDYNTYYTTLEFAFDLDKYSYTGGDFKNNQIVGLDVKVTDTDLDGVSVYCFSGADGWNVPKSNGSFIISTDEAVVTSISNLPDNKVSVFPNPVSNELNLRNASHFAGTIDLVDIDGRIVLSSKLSGSMTEKINVEKLDKGVYFLRMNNQSIKIIKK